MSPTIAETRLPLPGRRSGKVRDVYELPGAGGGAGRLLIVATDRISAFDVIMPTPVSGKGVLLTDVSVRWFGMIERLGLARTHLLSTDERELIGAGSPALDAGAARALAGRIMIARRCRVVPVECVARGYLDGSGWGEYQASGTVCGVALPRGLVRGDRLPEPIFTPATKEEMGRHDENIDFARACGVADEWLKRQGGALGSGLTGAALMERLRSMTLSIYGAAHAYAAERGLILADTKFEFGFEEGAAEPILVDEALTPDSSRYWDAAKWKPGGEQASFDKQFLREYLNGLTARGQWNKAAPGPELPADVVEGTRGRYEEVRRRLFG
ncbi:MAG: phosphoribosylaminoimidazolesuccinocarboxamide synthase [Planctomycetota bacterium]|nr:phosphoribosylaminoimidazolesuccinocarboxamide synthase [Planctomycetota bacterium]